MPLNLDVIRELLASRDFLGSWPGGDEAREEVLVGLADEVPGLVAEVERLRAFGDEWYAVAQGYERRLGCTRSPWASDEPTPLEAERDELRLTLLAEQGDPAGAPSGGWVWSGASGAWSRGKTTVGRISWLRSPAGDRACWWWDVPGVADGQAPTAREAMQAADAAAEGGEG